jgi:hypothetical protein
MAQNGLGADSTVWQLELGVAIASTGGATATYQFTDFSIAANREQSPVASDLS